MPRIPRAVIPNIPHHITQRGNRKQKTFFCTSDYNLYRELLAESCERSGVEIWAYCLMPNHAHHIAVPETPDSLRKAFGEAHRKYTRLINFREDWRGYLWQGRFASFPMNETYLLACARYVERNPVQAGLCARPEDYPWSSATAHLLGQDDALVKARPLLEMVPDWKQFIHGGNQDELVEKIRSHIRTGRPLGDKDFIDRLEDRLRRTLRPQKPGPKPKKKI